MRTAFASILMMAIAASASAQAVVDYRYFKDHGVFDPGVSDRTANALVREGITSADPVVQDLTIRALRGYAMHVVNDLPTSYGSPIERSFSAIPELKLFLIGYWREQHQRSGYNTLGAIQQGFGLEGVEWVVTVETLGLGEGASPDEIADAAAARIPVWTSVPQILCALFPGDDDVEELLWEMGRTDVSPGNVVKTLGLLNVGRFVTPEANAFRIDQLVDSSSGDGDRVAATIAAEGLALSRPVEAIPHLISAGLEHPSARGDMLVVLAGYDDDALSPYASEVAGLLSQTHVAQPMGAVADATSRLGTLVGRRATSDEAR